jgi:hypothetical protein
MKEETSMSEDSYERNDVPDFTQLLMKRISDKKSEETKTVGAGGFDPYKMMVNKKVSDEGAPIDTSNTIKWPEEDVKALEDFCLKYGIVGYNCGRMSPVAALSMLKSQFGIVDKPLEERVPAGYEKLGVKSKYNANYPYSRVINKKNLLNG